MRALLVAAVLSGCAQTKTTLCQNQDLLDLVHAESPRGKLAADVARWVMAWWCRP